MTLLLTAFRKPSVVRDGSKARRGSHLQAARVKAYPRPEGPGPLRNSGRNPTVTGERGGNAGCTAILAAERPLLCEGGKQSGNAEACRGQESPDNSDSKPSSLQPLRRTVGRKGGGFFHIPAAAFDC